MLEKLNDLEVSIRVIWLRSRINFGLQEVMGILKDGGEYWSNFLSKGSVSVEILALVLKKKKHVMLKVVILSWKQNF